MILKIFRNNFPSFSKWFLKTSELPLKCSPIFSQIFLEIFWGNYRKFPELFSIFLEILLEIFQNITQNFEKKYSIYFEILFRNYENAEYYIRYVALRCVCHVVYHTCHCDVVICDITLRRSTCSYLNMCVYTIWHYCILHVQCCV